MKSSHKSSVNSAMESKKAGLQSVHDEINLVIKRLAYLGKKRSEIK